SPEHRAHQRRRGDRGRVAGKRIRPFSAVIDPSLDDLNLFRPERPGRGHLWTELGAADLYVENAGAAVAGMDHAWSSRSAAQRVAASIEAQAGLVDVSAVAADTMLAENRLNIASEIDPVGRLRGYRHEGRRGHEHGPRDPAGGHRADPTSEV